MNIVTGTMAKPDHPEDLLTPEALEALLSALEPLAPLRAGAIKSRLMERVASEERDREAAGITVVRAAEGEWTALAPGVRTKVLSDDGRTRTWLARLERNARLPGHDHPADEECLMLEGTVYMGDILMAAGDYQIARAGSRHTGVYSPTGCLLLVRSASLEAVA